MPRSMGAVAIVLAAGKGKRFHSELPKVLHRINGVPMLHHVLKAVLRSDVADRVIVVTGGSGSGQVRQATSDAFGQVEFVDQPEQLGTGDAVRRCEQTLAGFEGTVVVLNGDGPLVTPSTIRSLVETHEAASSGVCLVSARLADPTGYGRIKRDDEGRVTDIIEEADATAADAKIDEVNSGLWAFSAAQLWPALGQIEPDNVQGEYYLPEAARVVASKGTLEVVMATYPGEVQGVNDRLQLADASRELRMRHLDELAASGVTIEDPATTFIDEGVEVGRDTVLRPLTFLEGSTRIGEGCEIGPSARIVDSTVGDRAKVVFAQVLESTIGDEASVGPFAAVRPGTELGKGAKVGTFVETKKAKIGDGSKVPHLSYIGDAEIGRDVNIGAGTITANYDSETKAKSKTKIGDGAFTSSNTVLRAPVSLGKKAGTGAGAVVTKDVEDGDVVVGVPAKPMRKRKDAKGEED